MFVHVITVALKMYHWNTEAQIYDLEDSFKEDNFGT